MNKIINYTTPHRGDIIYTDRGLYKHYGVYIGGNNVIHFAPKNGFELNPQDAYIQKTPLDDFLKDGTLLIDKDSPAKYSPEETARRAQSCLGTSKGEYNLVFHNCEHFARWCKSGVAESHQVQNAATALAVGAAVIAATAITAVAIDALSEKEENKR
jgi:hypothetical protein